MNILFHSKEGDSFSLARRAKAEKHVAHVFIESPKHKHMGDGWIDKVDDFKSALRSRPDLVVFDREGNGKVAEEIRKSGIPVVGASEFADKIELDRIYGLEFAHSVGIKIPDTFVVSSNKSIRRRVLSVEGIVAVGESFDDAREFITNDGGIWVFKPCGNKGTATTYVSHGPDDMIYMLDYMEKLVGENCDFILQRVVDGHEISSEGFFAGDHWVDGSFNFTIEDKKFLNGELGPNCGCAGNVVLNTESVGFGTIFRTYIYDKLGNVLSGKGFYGPIDVNAIWTKDGPVFLEFTPRFGYDAIQTWLQILQSDEVDAFILTATGKKGRIYVDRNCFAVGVRVSIPPYPHGDENAPKGLLVEGLNLSDSSLHPSDVQVDTENINRVITSGADGNIFTATAVGGTWNEAAASCYTKIREIRLADAQYRTDVGHRTDSVMSFLKYFGSPVPVPGKLSR